MWLIYFVISYLCIIFVLYRILLLVGYIQFSNFDCGIIFYFIFSTFFRNSKKLVLDVLLFLSF